jgi:hypothetical protein
VDVELEELEVELELDVELEVVVGSTTVEVVTPPPKARIDSSEQSTSDAADARRALNAFRRSTRTVDSSKSAHSTGGACRSSRAPPPRLAAGAARGPGRAPKSTARGRPAASPPSRPTRHGALGG